MNSEKTFDNDVIRIADLLEQVRELDRMIALHRQSAHARAIRGYAEGIPA